jgi:mannose-6-phosphate isomerase-like protein (cupin superfamily)
MRGVFAGKDIPKGNQIERNDVFFAMPLHQGQMRSGEWREGLIADKDYPVNGAIGEDVTTQTVTEEELIYGIILQVKGMLNNARIFIGEDASVELSHHHYGLARFREFGAVIITCISRAYCKKLVIQLPRQKHPYHYHAKKEETFQLLQGDLEVELNGQPYRLEPGDMFLSNRKIGTSSIASTARSSRRSRQPITITIPSTRTKPSLAYPGRHARRSSRTGPIWPQDLSNALYMSLTTTVFDFDGAGGAGPFGRMTGFAYLATGYTAIANGSGKEVEHASRKTHTRRRARAWRQQGSQT